MRMDIEHITLGNRFWSRINSLVKEAFPPEEYISPEMLVERASEENLDFLALTDEGSFVGIMVVRRYGDLAYLLYLAIDPSCRSKGYGSRAIETIRAEYPDRKLVVDFEMPDGNASNNDQRIRRRQFYLRNGYRETGLFVTYQGIDYEVFCMGDGFEHREYMDMWKDTSMLESPLEYFSR